MLFGAQKKEKERKNFQCKHEINTNWRVFRLAFLTDWQ
jgi:hypothetical protein